jgi:hypothetical protein
VLPAEFELEKAAETLELPQFEGLLAFAIARPSGRLIRRRGGSNIQGFFGEFSRYWF